MQEVFVWVIPQFDYKEKDNTNKPWKVIQHSAVHVAKSNLMWQHHTLKGLSPKHSSRGLLNGTPPDLYPKFNYDIEDTKNKIMFAEAIINSSFDIERLS